MTERAVGVDVAVFQQEQDQQTDIHDGNIDSIGSGTPHGALDLTDGTCFD